MLRGFSKLRGILEDASTCLLSRRFITRASFPRWPFPPSRSSTPLHRRPFSLLNFFSFSLLIAPLLLISQQLLRSTINLQWTTTKLSMSSHGRAAAVRLATGGFSRSRRPVLGQRRSAILVGLPKWLATLITGGGFLKGQCWSIPLRGDGRSGTW